MHLNSLLWPHKFLQNCVAYASPHISQEQSLQGSGIQVGFTGHSAQGLTSICPQPETHQGKGKIACTRAVGRIHPQGCWTEGLGPSPAAGLNSVSFLGIFPWFQSGANFELICNPSYISIALFLPMPLLLP